MVIFDIPKTVFQQRYEFEIEKIKIKYTGEWRKGIAIGYGSNPLSYQDIPYLITKDKVLYRGENDYYHVDEIYRTSEGYYLVYCYRDCSAPGKDSDYRGPFLTHVISEDGKTRISPYKMINGDMNTGWCDSNNKRVFVPREMGMGIIEFENSFYRLEDFKKLYDIPSKFKIESIFERGLCLLSVPEDNRDFIVTVKNKEAIDYIDVNNVDKLTELIEKTNDISLINYNCSENNAVIKVIKKQQQKIENKEFNEKRKRLKKVEFYSSTSYPRNYISKESATKEEFLNGIILSEEEIKKIQELYQTVCNEGENEGYEKYRFHIRDVEHISEHCLECMFYRDFMLLRIGGNMYDEHKMFSFYSLNGKCLSKKVYKNLQSTNGPIRVEQDKNFDNHIFYYQNGYKECGFVVIKDGKLYDNPLPEFMYNTYRWSIHEHFIEYDKERYDFFMNKITMNYVDIEIEEVIKKYLFRIKPDFQCYISTDHQAREKYIDGKLYLPTPGQLSDIQNELHFKRKNIPNYIKEVSYIADYVDNEGEPYSLYLFKCRPHAYCDSNGRVFYNFNPDKVVL